MKAAFILFSILYFLHLVVATGGGYAVLRLWNDRRSGPFINKLTIYLSAIAVEGVETITLLFFAKDVKFTWPFTIVLFAFMILKDVIRFPLIFFIIKGFK